LDKSIVQLLAAIPVDAFGPAPAEEVAAGDDWAAPASAALEGLLELMGSKERGGITPNEGRARALRVLPLDRIFKAHIGRVWNAVDAIMRTWKREYGKEEEEARGLLVAAYKTLAQLPLAWTLPRLLKLCSDENYRNEDQPSRSWGSRAASRSC
jgi:hypothetical protein